MWWRGCNGLVLCLGFLAGFNSTTKAHTLRREVCEVRTLVCLVRSPRSSQVHRRRYVCDDMMMMVMMVLMAMFVSKNIYPSFLLAGGLSEINRERLVCHTIQANSIARWLQHIRRRRERTRSSSSSNHIRRLFTMCACVRHPANGRMRASVLYLRELFLSIYVEHLLTLSHTIHRTPVRSYRLLCRSRLHQSKQHQHLPLSLPRHSSV